MARGLPVAPGLKNSATPHVTLIKKRGCALSPPEAESPNIIKALQIEQIDQALSPRPLREDELDNFWI